MASTLTINTESLHSPDAIALIGDLNAELTATYPNPGDNHFDLSAEQVSDGRGVFLIARLAGDPVGCAAVRALDPGAGPKAGPGFDPSFGAGFGPGFGAGGDVGEIKRMYVVPTARGTGVGRRLLAELEHHAGLLGLRHLVLETGDRQREAIGLYESFGFARIPRFGQYLNSPISVCMGKSLG